ncbi:hypothetical protein NUM3379_20190 [Kineococcus sp. NUM-3379]
MVTAAVASSSGTCQTPRPSCGISTPLFRGTLGTVDMVADRSGGRRTTRGGRLRVDEVVTPDRERLSAHGRS